MVPGGAPIAIFLTIATQTDIQTAVGAVIITSIVYFLVLPVFARCLKYFPKIVIGTMLMLVAINLVKIYGGIITGQPGSPQYGDPVNILLALSTIGFTLLFARILSGMASQLSVLFGLLAGAAVGAILGVMHFGDVLPGAVVSLPTVLPFGMPRFDLVAAVPMIVFSVIAIADVVGKEIDQREDVPKTIRGDALMSLIGGIFGTSLIITSGENIGVVKATGIKSRYVTAVGGAILIVLALFAPLGRLIYAIPGPVVGGTAMIVFCIIAVMGVDMLRKVDLSDHGNVFTLAAGIGMGLLPILVPGVYSHFPRAVQMVLGNGLAAGTIATVLLNTLFHHLGKQAETEVPAGAVAAVRNGE
jgi:xanthine/uracil permease